MILLPYTRFAISGREMDEGAGVRVGGLIMGGRVKTKNNKQMEYKWRGVLELCGGLAVTAKKTKSFANSHWI